MSTESTTEAPAASSMDETLEAAEDPQEQPQEQPQEPEAETEDQEQPQEGEDEQADQSKAAKQAAKYRRQLRETEAERDQLHSEVATLRTAIAETALETVLDKPSSLWLTGADPATFYNESGNLDGELLHRVAREAAKEYGLKPYSDFQGYVDGGPRPDPAPAPRQFSDMFSASKR